MDSPKPPQEYYTIAVVKNDTQNLLQTQNRLYEHLQAFYWLCGSQMDSPKLYIPTTSFAVAKIDSPYLYCRLIEPLRAS